MHIEYRQDSEESRDVIGEVVEVATIEPMAKISDPGIAQCMPDFVEYVCLNGSWFIRDVDQERCEEKWRMKA
jgi:hypothetical protein